MQSCPFQLGSPAKTNGGSQHKSGNSILSPPQLKKPTPAPVQGPLGSDLLKAIRDGESAAFNIKPKKTYENPYMYLPVTNCTV